MIHSLAELKTFLTKNDIVVQQFNGWSLRIERDTWTLSRDVFYRNGAPASVKEKALLELYVKTKARKWKAISTRKVI